MQAPACSIIVPVYNDQGGFLADALNSLAGQTFTSWEAIVVDDGSDNALHTADVVRAMRDDRVRLVQHGENRGLAAARNTGIRAATSGLIVTLDSDDMFVPGYLEAVLPHLVDGSPYTCVFTDIETFGGTAGRISHKNDDVITLLRRQWLPGGGIAYRRTLWEQVGGYWENPTLRIGDEDREFWIGALKVGLRIKHIPEPLFRYRVGHGSMTSRLTPLEWRTHEAIYARHEALFRRHGQGHAFLADGYIRSGRAVRELGHRRAAIGLALRALRHEPTRVEAVGVIGRALLPEPLHDWLRTARRRIRHEQL
jgi:glycosyltransferase involved in cell wall biosynthesis